MSIESAQVAEMCNQQGRIMIPMTEVTAPAGMEETPKRYLLVPRIAIIALVATLGLMQYLTPLSPTPWLYFLQRLYYIPIVISGLTWGYSGGLSIALLSGILFMIGTPSIWQVSSSDKIDQFLETLMFLMVGLIAGVLTDRQHKYERELRASTKQLNAVYRELQENFDGMKRAERLYALGQLSAGLAHEIRNPLASIEGAAIVIQRGEHSESSNEFLEIIQKECRRLNGLLSTFLEFAKPRQPHVSTISLESVFDSVIALATHGKQAEQLEFRKQLQPGLSVIRCDAEQLTQVLLNLAINAMQASPVGGVILLAAEQNDTHTTIDVQDQGSGIPSEIVEHIFDPFFTTKAAGTGLGLSVAHQIIMQHGGALTVGRNSPEGVTFRISLPRQPLK